jgi:hypothetical protein
MTTVGRHDATGAKTRFSRGPISEFFNGICAKRTFGKLRWLSALGQPPSGTFYEAVLTRQLI